MLWEVLPGRKRHRFTHISDSKGEIVFVGPVEGKRFENASPYSLIIDECLLEKSLLTGTYTIGIGFYAKDAGTTQIVGGAHRGGRDRNH